MALLKNSQGKESRDGDSPKETEREFAKFLEQENKKRNVAPALTSVLHLLFRYKHLIKLNNQKQSFSQLGSCFTNIQLTSPTQTRMIFIGTKAKLAKSPVRSKLVW